MQKRVEMDNSNIQKNCFIIILICISLLLGTYIRRQDQIKIVYCKIVESKQDEILLKQVSGIDQSLYDSIDIYFVIDGKHINKFDELIEASKVDLNKEIRLVFRCNKILDFAKEGKKVFFDVREIVEIGN